MATLPTNLKDDILDASINQRRRYNMITNPDGTVEFEDVTAYSQVGSEYGAGLINETNKQVNAKVEKAVVVRDLDTIGAITQPGFIPDALALKDVNDSLTADNAKAFQFAYDSATQKYGYKVKEADTDVFVPFKSGGELTLVQSLSYCSYSGKENGTNTWTVDNDYDTLYVFEGGMGTLTSVAMTFALNSNTGTYELINGQSGSDAYSISSRLYKVNNVKTGDKITLTPSATTQFTWMIFSA